MSILYKILSGSLIIIITGIIIPLAACNGVYIHSNDDKKLIKERSFPISPGKNLMVRVSSGDVMVTSWDKAEVQIKIYGDEDECISSSNIDDIQPR